MEDISTIQWPGWKTVRLIGRGSYGAVYEIERDLFGKKEKAALKHIGIPQNPSDIEEMYSDGYDDESITASFQSHLESIVAEYSLMRKLNGAANVVNCDDVKYVQRKDGIGWDIFIKMELLTPLTKALPDPIPEETVVKIAKDMCHVLSLCKRFDIVHRDIKPQNIFASPLGDYKLGDFGIAKTVEKTMGGTKTGTYKYMAPEVYNNQPYGQQADIYSLGLVLYWLLNKRRMPFMPLPPQKLTAGMDEQARNRRLSGEPLPAPADGNEELKRIVLKACAYDPAERYHTADEMLADLNALEDERSRQAVRLTSPAEDSQPIPQPATLADEEGTVGAFGSPTAAIGASIARPTGPLDEDEATVGAFGAAAQNAPVNPKAARKYATEKPEPKPLAAEPKAAPAADFRQTANSTQAKAKKRSKTLLIAAIAAALVLVIGLVIWKPWASTGHNQQPGQRNVNRMMISAFGDFTVGLRSNGTALAVGNNEYGQCNVSDWTDIIAISAGGVHTVGLCSDGTVLAVGPSNYGRLDVSDWTDVIAISAGIHHTVGLRSDGTVLAVGWNDDGQCNVSDWTDVIAISAGAAHTVGLRSDGTVLAVGWNNAGQCNVSDWTDIIAISAGNIHTVGLRSDGTVLAIGNNQFGECDVSGWTDVVAISAGTTHTVGLRSDGTVLAAGANYNGECNVSDWNLASQPSENPSSRPSSHTSDESKTLDTPSTSADDAASLDVHIAIINSGAKSYDDAVISGVRTWCEQNSAIKSPKIYNPADDSTDAFIEAIETAIDEGNQFLIFDSFMQAQAIAETVDDYPDVCFICLEISEWDLQAGRGTESDFSWDYPQNLYIATFREEQAGYLAGYAAVKMGYRELGFLGGVPVPAVVKYGYGFVQGANDAAIQNGVASEVRIKYVYGNQYYGDADIDAYMENWYKNGTSVVFAAGGMIYTSAAQAAAHYGGKVIGMDIDQAKDIDGQYGDGITLTSAVKGFGPAAASYLTRIMSEGLKGGHADLLGINTDNPAKSFIQLAPSTQYQGSFGEEDYEKLLRDLYSGELTVSSDISSEPVVSITVDYQGNIK